MTGTGLRRAAVAVLFAVAVLVLTAAAAFGSFPGRNGRIAYTADDGRIHTIRPSGRGDQPIGPVSSDGPAWAPGGKRLAFVLGGERWNTWANIYAMSADGSDSQPITASTHEDNLNPSYSPGGRRILFITQGCCNDRFIHIYQSDPHPHIRHLRIQDREGTRLSSAVWAPTRKIAYTLKRKSGDIYDIWTIRPDGTHEQRVVRHGVNPMYAPSGKRFIFSRFTHGHYRFLVANADGSNIRRPPCNRRIEKLTQLVTYSPNGEWILATKDHYQAARYISTTLVRLSLRSCKRYPVVSGTGHLSQADWQALPAG
jgi:Tol biopolymer transport system component